MTFIICSPKDAPRMDRLTQMLRTASGVQDKAFDEWRKTSISSDDSQEECFNANWIPYGLLRAHDLQGSLFCLWASPQAMNWGVGMIRRRWEKLTETKNNNYHSIVGHEARDHPDLLHKDVILTPVTNMYRILGVVN